MVVLVHVASSSGDLTSGPLAGFWLALSAGLPILVAVSGFVLYRQFLVHTPGRPRVLQTKVFLLRRGLRIGPAYWVALAVLWIFPGLPATQPSWAPIYFGFAQVYFPETVLGGLAVAWTLCVEVTFYAVLVLLGHALVAGRRASRLLREPAVLAGVLLAVSIAHPLLALAASGETYFRVTHTLLGTFDWFLAGMLLAAVGQRRYALTGARHLWLLWPAGVVLLIAQSILLEPVRETFAIVSSSQPAAHLFATAIALLALSPVAFDARGRAVDLMSHSLLVWVGTVSFGLYLWHRPLIQWIYDTGERHGWPTTSTLELTLAGLAVTLPLAAASWYLIERPLIRLGRRASASPAHPRTQPD